MTRIDVRVPEYAQGAKSIKLSQWLKSVGDDVKQGENIVEATTDKISVYIEAPADGKLVAIMSEAGDTVAVGELIAQLEA